MQMTTQRFNLAEIMILGPLFLIFHFAVTATSDCVLASMTLLTTLPSLPFPICSLPAAHLRLQTTHHLSSSSIIHPSQQSSSSTCYLITLPAAILPALACAAPHMQCAATMYPIIHPLDSSAPVASLRLRSAIAGPLPAPGSTRFPSHLVLVLARQAIHAAPPTPFCVILAWSTHTSLAIRPPAMSDSSAPTGPADQHRR